MPRPPRRSALLFASLCTSLGAGCGPRRPPEDARAAMAKLPPVKVSSEDEYAAVRADYDVLPIGDPRRVAARAGLEAWALAEVERDLKANRAESAWDTFAHRTLALWDPAELQAPPPDAPLASTARALERAFARRGAHQETLTALAVEIALAPTDPAPRARFAQVVQWLRIDPSATVAADEDAESRCSERACGRIIEDLEAAVAVWPSPFAVAELARLYQDRPAWQHGGHHARDLADMLNERTGGSAWDLARLYLRLSQPDEALAAMRKLDGLPGDVPRLRELLERYLSAAAKPVDAVAIAAMFFRDPNDRPVAQRVCEDAARRFPQAVEPLLCVGDVAEQRELFVRAIGAFEAALERDPARRETWEALARLRQKRLMQLVSDEKTGELEAELRRVERLHDDATKRFPGQPLRITVSRAVFEVGRGYFNAGRVDDAVKFFERSQALEPSVPALEELGTIALKRGDGPRALALLERAQLLAAASDRRSFLYWRAQLGRLEGDAQELRGDAAAAEKARRQAAADFELLLKSQDVRSGEDAAELLIERGKALYDLGERDEAIAELEKAIDAAPDRGATYADVLAFLVPRGEREEALDAYHRALGRSEVSEYLKVYCTLWILDLDRRASEPEDPLARAFLDGVDGGKWYHALARWATGRETEKDLDAQAQNASNRAEAWFYEAMRRLEDGKLDEARALWRKVVDTQMMAFFEYDMASYYLRRGAHARPEPSTRRAGTEVKVTPPPRIPDGSI